MGNGEVDSNVESEVGYVFERKRPGRTSHARDAKRALLGDGERRVGKLLQVENQHEQRGVGGE